jgi:hypothetical protein
MKIKKSTKICITIILIILLLIVYTVYNHKYYTYYITNYNYTPLNKYLDNHNTSSDLYNNPYSEHKIVFLFSHDYKILPKSAEYAIDITNKYCKQYNYELIVKNHYPNNTMSPYWLRVFDLIELSNKYDDKTIFVYLDLDATINPKYFNLKLTDLIYHIDKLDGYKYDIYIGKDLHIIKYINTGVMFFKNTITTKNILQLWSTYYNKDNWNVINNKWVCTEIINNYQKKCAWARDQYEQGALEYIYSNNINNYKKNINILHISICSNPFYDFDCFIYHFMGYSEYKRLKNMKKIHDKII